MKYGMFFTYPSDIKVNLLSKITQEIFLSRTLFHNSEYEARKHGNKEKWEDGEGRKRSLQCGRRDGHRGRPAQWGGGGGLAGCLHEQKDPKSRGHVGKLGVRVGEWTANVTPENKVIRTSGEGEPWEKEISFYVPRGSALGDMYPVPTLHDVTKIDT